ncbi:MAG TPA: hypothetical protein VEC11_01770 [Allosphingosinicella sp.]|nr:hypothetical protein [Allosphingosinicella sp.]
MRNPRLVLGAGASILAAFAGILLFSIGLAHLLAAGPGEVTGWVQAIGSIFAVVAGFGVAAYQVQKQREDVREEMRERARAAHKLAFQAYRLIGERLATALSRKDRKSGPASGAGQFDLKGYRTTEMVAAMREFDTGRPPTPLIESFVELRTRVFAINERISQLYEREDSQSPEDRVAAKALRYGKLESSVRVYARAGESYTALDAAARDHFGIESLGCAVPPAIATYGAPTEDAAPE